MPEVGSVGKLLIVAGVVIFAVGILMLVGPRIPFPGRLPGDPFIKREGFSLYVPIVTSVVLSIILTLVLNLAFRFFHH